MIKINLSPQRRPKATDRGQRSFLIGALAYIAAGAVVFLFIHSPKAEAIEQLSAASNTLARTNTDKEKDLKGFEELRKAIADARARQEVVLRLNRARAVPAHMLHELSRVLTNNSLPTATAETRTSIEQGAVREFVRDWDPTHVWISNFKEEDGTFRLEGGAQSDSDMTQLALRLQASVFFYDIVPEGGSEATDKESGNTFYKFTITGKVAY